MLYKSKARRFVAHHPAEKFNVGLLVPARHVDHKLNVPDPRYTSVNIGADSREIVLGDLFANVRRSKVRLHKPSQEIARARHCAAVREVIRPQRNDDLQKTTPRFFCTFPYVCPEPVLAK